MELQVYLIIATVFFVSLCSLLFVNRQLRGGKTFEEALAEKRHLTDKLYGNKKKNAKKANTGKKNRDRKDAKQPKAVQQPIAVESDGKSDSGSEIDANAAATVTDGRNHVEFTEEEIIAPETNTVQFTRQLSTGKIVPPVRKMSASKSPGSGILLNKSTCAAKPAPPANGTIETLNHFEKIHPKDDLEIKKHRDESIGRTNANKKEHGKKGKAAKKDNNSSASNTIAVADKNNVAAVNDATDAPLATPIESVAVQQVVAVQVSSAPSKESPKNTANKDKPNKKKRNDALLVQQLVEAGVASTASDIVNVNAIMQQLGRAELTRNEIQILIDFLLNKQQDTANVAHSDWSDDPVHKLRNQLEEKDRSLAEEQKAMLAIQTKLRELRAELNAERTQAAHLKTSHLDELNALKADLNQIQQDRQLLLERTNTEKQALNKQLQHLQQKLFQEKNAQAQAQEQTQQIQQLTEANAQLSAEMLNKTNIIQDMQEKFLQIRNEHLNKINDCEQKYQDVVRTNEQDVAFLNGEMLRLRNECQRNEELEKQYARKTFDYEQLELRLNEQNKQSTQIEDCSKVEIRNLQNALDSTKTELTLSRTELADNSKRVEELTSQLNDAKTVHETEQSAAIQKFTKQIDELNSMIQSYRNTISEKEAKLNELQSELERVPAVDQREQELFKQIADYKEKNNELRKKNWKLIDALQKAEESALKITSKCKLVTTSASLSPSKITATTAVAAPTLAAPPPSDDEKEHILRTKQVLERLFPNVPSTDVDYETWLENLSTYIEEQHQQQQKENHVKSNNSNPTVAATTTNNNHQLNGDGDSSNTTDENITGNGTHHHSGQDGDDSGKLSPSEELMIQNAKLKSIVAETSEILISLEKKACLQDAYWRSIVQSKDNEIRSLQQNSESST